MNIFTIKKHVGDLKRFKEIMGILFEQGFDVVIDQLRLHYFIPWRSRVRRGTVNFDFKKKELIQKSGDYPERLRITFEKLGPTFIKFGQILSVRTDIIPEEYAKELEKLQDRVPSFPYEQVKEILRTELKVPLEKIFKKFDVKPIAAASLSQVHIATLHNNKRVAVKIQRPGISDIIKKDINILFFFARLLENRSSDLRKLRPVRIVKEFADWTLRELDFFAEAGHIERFTYNLKEYEDVIIPQVYKGYSTAKVLVLEYKKGIKCDSISALKRAGIDPEKMAALGMKIGFKQFFIDGFFHADPHPGNFVAQKGDKLVLYDFGMVGYLSPHVKRELVNCFINFINRRPEEYVRHLLHIAETDETSDTRGFAKHIMTILNGWMFSSDIKKNIGKSFYNVISQSAKYNVIFPSDLVLFGKSLMAIEASAKKLYPDLDVHHEMKPYIKNIYLENLNPKKVLQKLQTDLPDYMEFLRALPERTDAMFKKVEKGEFGVRINASEIEGLKREFDRQNDVRVLSILIVALIIGSAIVLRLEQRTFWQNISLGQIGLMISAVLFVWLIVLVRRK